MERDINVVANVKKDGSVAFKTGDGLPLEMGGGKAMRNVTFFSTAFLPTSVKAFIPDDPDDDTVGHYVELKPMLKDEEAGAGLFSVQIPVGLPPKHISINFVGDPELPSLLGIVFYKTVGDYSLQAGLTSYFVTEYDHETGVCVISIQEGSDYVLWIPSDIYIRVDPHTPH